MNHFLFDLLHYHRHLAANLSNSMLNNHLAGWVLHDYNLLHDIFKLRNRSRYFKCGLRACVSFELSVKIDGISSLFLFSQLCFFFNFRAMATCQILMFGRIGAICGSNIIGLLLNLNCNAIFYINFIMLLSKCWIEPSFSHE